MSIESGLSFAPSSDEEAMVSAFRRFAESEVRPLVQGRHDQMFSRQELGSILGSLSAHGLPGGPLPSAAGGLGLRWTSYCLLFEELAKVSASLALSVLIQGVVGTYLARHAPLHIREKYLPGLLSGEIVAAIAISEPNVGSNVAEVQCRARRLDDGWLLEGEKSWITNGHHSDFVVCVARTGSQRDDISLFLVDRAESQYQSREIPKLGLRSTSTAQLLFDSTKIPLDSRLTAPGEGLRNVMGVFEIARPLVGSVAVGIAQRALDLSVQYACERQQHGKAIAGHQLVQAMLAEMSSDVDAARLLVLRAFDSIDRGARAEVPAAMAKWYATEKAFVATSKAIQIHGGNGITTEYPLEGLFRDARMLTIPDGTTEIQKLVLGRRLTGVGAF